MEKNTQRVTDRGLNPYYDSIVDSILLNHSSSRVVSGVWTSNGGVRPYRAMEYKSSK